MHLEYFLALTGDRDSKEIPVASTEWQDIPENIENPTKDDFRISPFESEEMSKADMAADFKWQASLSHGAAKVAFALPQIGAKIQPLGGEKDITMGGEQVDKALEAYAWVLERGGEKADMDSSKAGRKAVAIRQLQERRLQANNLGWELMRIDKDITVLRDQLDTYRADIEAQNAEVESAEAEKE
ncbi:hypothetical protein N7478_007790 [Penicillium angulare]|uniref:uncharacterized protein n=1 Tax=Penicillium angulare TaxID=116970 RepID=UPI00254225A7|nr:uncharacterized protein N7478_007790 [Penicillium angulare]KAJ5272665.1 hypothetical protein N7478_007790 [Penicillium angulare]